MNTVFINKRLEELFDLISGDYHVVGELDSGNTPLVSCGELNNGVIGYYNVPEERTYSNCLTCAYNGQPLTTKYHPYIFGAKDDVAVLIPLNPMKETTLLYIAGRLNDLRWRYSYGRKCFNAKMRRLSISVPVIDDDLQQLDEKFIEDIFSRKLHDYIPSKTIYDNTNLDLPQDIRWGIFSIQQILKLQRGDFHALSVLDTGRYMTVSRVTTNNGVVGYFDKPDDATVYKSGFITVSTVGGDAFVQLKEFIATDNVVVCKPKFALQSTSLVFITFILNQQKWRYSYGRQCYINKLAQLEFYLPILPNGDLDEATMAFFVKQSPYWSYIENMLSSD